MKKIQLNNCRVCGGKNLKIFLSLGLMPPINKFPKNKEEAATEKLFPLETAFCKDCSHVQLTMALDQEDTFSDYIYFSSNSRTFVEHGRWLAKEMGNRLDLTKDDLVVEIASNDGVFLKSFKALPVRVLGVEPAKNIAEVARNAGIPTVSEFFGADTAEEIKAKHGQAKLIIGANVLAHAFYLRDFVRGLKLLLKQDGTILIEVPYIANLLENNECDTIYHEHISYFSVFSLQKLFASEGLNLYDVKHLPNIHGGSLLAIFGHSNGPHKIRKSVNKFLQKESKEGLQNFDVYKNFAKRIITLKKSIPKFILKLKKTGKTVAAYGAAAKGNVLLQFCGINTTTIPFVVDKSPYKQGRLTPGTHIPVVALDHVAKERPDYLIILAWNFAKEIMDDLVEYSRSGGQYIVLLPKPKIINKVRHK